MDYKDRYEQWLNDKFFDGATHKKNEDRFYRDLEFGTSGLQGVMGVGTNHMNKCTVGKATMDLVTIC